MDARLFHNNALCSKFPGLYPASANPLAWRWPDIRKQASTKGICMRVLMIGCGNMGRAMLTRWLCSDIAQFAVITRSGVGIPDGAEAVTCADALGRRIFDVIIIAIKPQQIAEVMPRYARHLAEDGCIVSLAAGTSAASIAKTMLQPAIVRIMPNRAALIGQSVNGVFATEAATATHKAFAEALAVSTGSCIWVDQEDKIDRITAIAGSGTGYVFEIARSYVSAAEALGFSEAEARELVLETLSGAIEMARQSTVPLAEMRDAVVSPNGTTAAGLAALTADGQLSNLLGETVDAAYERACELRGDS